MMLVLDILVIGAGMAGLVAATELQKSGYDVACVEKARGSGGRLSSKRIKSEKTGDVIGFDLGCASFDAKTEFFKSQVEQWVSAGVAKEWRKSELLGSQYVAIPRSSSITRYMADQLEIHFATRITEIRKEQGFWLAYTGGIDDRVLFAKTKHIVFATPPQQAADLLLADNVYKSILSQSILLPQWVLMLNIKGHLNFNDDYIEFSDSIISRLIFEHSKPLRAKSPNHEVWMIQADTQWTANNLDTDKKKLEHELVAELAVLAGSPVVVDDAYLHRWLYSIAQKNELSGRLYLDDSEGIWLCGDYLADTETLSGVEAAYTSAQALVKNFLL